MFKIKVFGRQKKKGTEIIWNEKWLKSFKN